MLWRHPNAKDMKTDLTPKKPSLKLRGIFKCMMEGGYYPTFEDGFIRFVTEENTAIVDYENGILSVRILFSIAPEEYDLFLEASNLTMQKTAVTKAVILMDMENIMFSCENFCYTESEFRKFFPLMVENVNKALHAHRHQMRRLIHAMEAASTKVPATDEAIAGNTNKILS